MPCGANPCLCQPGYAQCGPGICCLRYKNMAKRYSQRVVTIPANETSGSNSNVTKAVDDDKKTKVVDGVEMTRVNVSEGPDPKTMVLKVYKKNETVSLDYFS